MKARCVVMLLILTAVTLKADPVTTNSASAITDTAWAVVDDHGDRFEIRFESAGDITSRRITSHWIGTDSSSREPFIMSKLAYEVSKGGKWTQRGSEVEFTLEDPTDSKMAESLHPNYVYTGTLAGSRLNGTRKSTMWGSHRWAAVSIKELTNRSDGPAILLVGKYPPFPRTSNADSGTATVRLTISPAGDVVETNVVEASAKEFGSSAEEVMVQWKFLPAVKGGEPVPATIKIAIPFTRPVVAGEK